MSVNLGSVFATIELHTAGVKDGVKEVNRQFDYLKDNVEKSVNTIVVSLTAVGASLLFLAKTSASKFGEFNDAITRASSNVRGGADVMEDFRKTALKATRDTTVSSIDAAKALDELAGGVISANDAMELLPDVVKLMEVGQLDAADASKLLSDMMVKFGITTEEASNALDILNTSTKVAYVDRFPGIVSFMNQAAGTAKTLGLDLRETAVYMTLLGDAGFRGQKGGNALNRAFVMLSKSLSKDFVGVSDLAKNSINRLQSSLFYANGEVKKAPEFFSNLKKEYDNIQSPIDRTTVMTSLFGDASQAMTGVIVGLTGNFEDYDKMLSENIITMDESFDAIQANQDPLKVLSKMWEDLRIELGGPVSSVLNSVNKNGLQPLYEMFSNLSPEIKTIIGWVITLGGMLLTLVGSMMLIVVQIAKFKKALKVLQLASKLSLGTIAAWSIVVLAALVAIVAIIRSINSWRQAQERATKSQADANKLEMEANAARKIAARDNISLADALVKVREKTQGTNKEVGKTPGLMDNVGASAGDMALDNSKATNEMRDGIEKLNKDYEKSNLDRKEDFEDRLKELVMDHKQKINELKSDIENEKKNFIEAQQEKKQSFMENLAEMADGYNEKIAGFKDSIDEENDYFKDKIADRKESYDDDLIVYKDTHDDKLTSLQEELDEELAKGKDADSKKITNLKSQIKKENTEYDKKLTKRKDQYDDDVADDQKAHDKKLTQLNGSITKAEIEYEKDVNKRTATYDKDVSNDKKRYDDKMETLNTSLGEEESVVKENADDFAKFKDAQKDSDIKRLKDQYDEEMADAKIAYQERLEEIKTKSTETGEGIASGIGAGNDLALNDTLDTTGLMKDELEKYGIDAETLMGDAGEKSGMSWGDSFLDAYTDFITKLPSKLEEVRKMIANFFWNKIILGALDWGAEMLNKFIIGIGKGMMGIGAGLAEVIRIISVTVSGWYTKAFEWGQTLLDNLGSGIWNKLSELGKTANKIWTYIWDGIKGMFDDSVKWGKDLVGNIIKGIKDMLNGLVAAGSIVAQKLKELFHFSVPDKGPLKDADTWMPDMMKLFSKGISSGIPTIIRGAQEAANALSGVIMPSLALNPSVGGLNANLGGSVGGFSTENGKKEASQTSISVNINNPVISSELDAERIFAEGARRLELAFKGIPK